MLRREEKVNVVGRKNPKTERLRVGYIPDLSPRPGYSLLPGYRRSTYKYMYKGGPYTYTYAQVKPGAKGKRRF